MNRTEFMNRLEQLLWDIPESERREALQYYNDYFDDAGPENEEKIIRELGCPARVARTIREGMSENGEYTEHGYEDGRFRNHQDVAADAQEPVYAKASDRPKPPPNLWKILSIFLLCLLLFPIIVPLCAVLIIIPAAVLIGVIGIVIAAAVVAVVLPVVGLILLGVAFYNLFVAPAAGIALAGVGFLLLSFGILTFLLTVWSFKAVFPLCVRGIVSILRYPLRKAGIVR